MTDLSKELIATVIVPTRNNVWGGDDCHFFARFRKYRKWWKFWEDNYEDVPLQIVDLNAYAKKSTDDK